MEGSYLILYAQVSGVCEFSVCQHFQRTTPLKTIASIGWGKDQLCFCSGQLRSMVAMATFIFNILRMRKVKTGYIFLSNGDIFFLTKILIEKYSLNKMFCPNH